MLFKHLKRKIPKSLFTAIVLALSLLLPAPVQAQSLPDSILDQVRALMVRMRAANRQSETYGTQIIDLLPPPPGPPAVMDWRTGEWDVLAGGYRVVLDLTHEKATAQSVTAPITAVAAGDTLRVRLDVPGYTDGLLEMVHAEGRMIGTVRYGEEERPASGQRPFLMVVRKVSRSPCTFAQYTDGSWGVTPYNSNCLQSLDNYAGPFRYVAREYIP